MVSRVPCRRCLEARDPYCGWDLKQRRCTTLEDSSNMSQWSQNITVCPVRARVEETRLSSFQQPYFNDVLYKFTERICCLYL